MARVPPDFRWVSAKLISSACVIGIHSLHNDETLSLKSRPQLNEAITFVYSRLVICSQPGSNILLGSLDCKPRAFPLIYEVSRGSN